jgi:prepilin-type N-terminal cleavage/methylation domain-containing protein
LAQGKFKKQRALDMIVRQPNQAGFSLMELVIVCAIIGVVAAIALASFANRDEGSRLAQDVASRIRARRAAAIRLNSLVQPTLLENYKQPPISIDFINATTTASLVTEGTAPTIFTAPGSLGSTGTWNYVYQGNALTLPAGWRVATSSSSLSPIPVISLGTPATVFNFTGDGRLDASSLPATPANTNPNQESQFPAIYLTNGRTARAVAVHPSGLTEIWQYEESAGTWRGFSNRTAVAP